MAPFILRPTVTSVSESGGTITVDVNPPVREGQRATLLLNERLDADPAEFSIPLPPVEADAPQPQFPSPSASGEFFVLASRRSGESGRSGSGESNDRPHGDAAMSVVSHHLETWQLANQQYLAGALSDVKAALERHARGACQAAMAQAVTMRPPGRSTRPRHSTPLCDIWSFAIRAQHRCPLCGDGARLQRWIALRRRAGNR